MPRPAVLIALLLSIPAFASHWAPQRYTSEAREELAELRDFARGVRDPYARGEILDRIDHIDDLVAAAEDQMSAPPPPPSRVTFDDARRMISHERFDDDRLDVIRRVAASGRFTTSEAAALADLCVFESTKVDALIALYPSVVDRDRFGLALTILDFSSSRREVEQAIGSYGAPPPPPSARPPHHASPHGH